MLPRRRPGPPSAIRRAHDHPFYDTDHHRRRRCRPFLRLTGRPARPEGAALRPRGGSGL